MVKPLVTIGICVKNCESFIEEVVMSVINQNFPHELMEIIVVDGNSEDKTVPIIKETLTGIEIKTRFLNENNGLGYARQLVVDNAKGDYIVWVDGDIILSEDYVKRQVEFLEQNPLVGVAGGSYGMYLGNTLASAFENIVYVVDSYKHSGKIFPRLLGTEGSFFRAKAIRDAGGFDRQIVGAAEDTELIYRMKKKGWLLCKTKATFVEKCKEDWKGLWKQYEWWGYGGHYLFHKDQRIAPLYEMTPPSGFVSGLLRCSTAYKLTHRKIFFLIPIHYTFKRIAWCYGFIKAHLDKYQKSDSFELTDE